MATPATASGDPLPLPTGAHPVGRVSFDWVDHARFDIYAANPDAHRELVVFVWYPASPQPAGNFAPYLPLPWAPTADFLGLDVSGLRSHAIPDARLAAGRAAYPVLLLSPSGFTPLLLGAIAEELASHGFIVVGVNHTYEATVTAFADGRVVPANPAALGGALGPQSGSHTEVFRQRASVCEYKAADLASVADQLENLNTDPTERFTGRIDLARLSALGHSFGGDAALEFCRNDQRCRAAANLDGALWSDVGRVGLDGPVLQVLAEHGEFAVTGEGAVKAGAAPNVDWFEAEKVITFGGWRNVQQVAQPGYTVQVSGASHISFMDVPFLPVTAASIVKPALLATKIQPGRMWRITCDLLLAFFAKHLNGAAAPLLDNPADDYPELTVGPP
jgi:Platelet-activating factor acetylhydrolase, isoform II